MSRAHKITNLFAVSLPFAALITAIALLWNHGVGPLDLGLMLGLYVFTCLGVTLGYHRMFTHRSFQSSRAFRAIIAVIGSMAVEGSVITWVADHRKHHAFTDAEGDPHSPHLSGPGFLGALKGLWHAHVGWLFENVGQADRERFAPDMVKDPALRIIDKTFFLWIAISFAIPFGLGWLIGGGIASALSALLWGGLVRVFLLHHITWSVNSICHFVGRRRFEVEDESRNVFWLAPLSMGEGWHHNHHAFPTSAFHGLRLGELLTDPTGLVILLLEKLGLVWNVVRISPEKQRAKLMSAASTGAQRAAAGAQAAKASAQAARASAQAAVANAGVAAAAGAQAASSGAMVRPAPSRLSQ
ncbi:MAG TPA: acyl-CoA desaturase [Solirubrobacteraceae bacterium]|nr:acyl-CoA desaturase [Solirubrobacteraceae bacterium]